MTANADLFVSFVPSHFLEGECTHRAEDQKSGGTSIGVLLGALFLLCGLSAPVSQAQTGRIVGTVTDSASGETVPGVNVVIVGTTQGAATNAEGRYTIDAVDPGSYELRASFVGYEAIEKSVDVGAGETTTVDFALQPSAQQLEDLVVVGYGRQEEASVSGSISEVESEDLADIAVANNTDKLAGRVAGLVTRQTSGRPGGDYRNLSIRGFGNPLVLVDGVEMRMSQIDPNNIESITVLKDASAAVYGMRAGNGVILVETKRGSDGQSPDLNYTSKVTVQTPTEIPDQVDAGQYAEMQRDGAMLYDQPPSFTEDEVECYKTRGEATGCGDPALWQSYDWYDAIYDTWTPQQEHSLSARGGSDLVNFFVSGSYLNQGSAFTSGDINFERWSARGNVDVDVSDHVTAALDLSYRREFRENPGRGFVDIWNELQQARPWLRPTIPDTTGAAWSGTASQSPLGSTERDFNGFDESKQDYLNGRLELTWDTPIEGLTSRGELSYFFRSFHDRLFQKPFPVFRFDEENQEPVFVGQGGTVQSPEISEDLFRSQRFKPTIRLDYSNSFGSHTVDGLLLGEWITETDRSVGASRQDLLAENLPFLFVGADDESKDNYGGKSEEGRQSVVGRLNYNYDERYILEAVMRADGSYKFAPGSRWGYFPGVSAAWRLTEEDFFPDGAFDDLKLRLSYSQTGDDQGVSAFEFLSGFRIAGTYIVEGSPERGISPTSIPVPDVTWLQHTQYNAGLDGTLWGGRLGFEADVFYRYTNGRFGPRQKEVPGTVGATLAPENINETADRGFEVKLSHENTIGDFSYSVSPNFSFTRRRLVEIAEEEFDEPWQRRVSKNQGKWARRNVGYVALGTFEDQEEIDQWPVEQDESENATLKPGDIKYKDLNGDGVIDQKDQKQIGDGGTPNINYGMSFQAQYGGFSLSGLLQGATMYNINMTFRARGGFAQGGTPYRYQYENRWTEENKDAALPATFTNSAVNSNNSRYSSFWLKDGTYLRLKNLNISYRFPESWIDPLGIQSLRMYMAGSNILTFDRLGIFSEAFDPEGASGGFGSQSGRSYPLHKTFSLGIDLSL